MNIIAFLYVAAIGVLAAGYSVAQNTGDAKLSNEDRVEQDARQLRIPQGYTKNLKWNLPLDSVGINGSVINWQSNNLTYVSHDGKLMKRPARNESVKVRMTATLTAGAEKRTKQFTVKIAPQDPIFNGYLFSYFEGAGPKQAQEQIRFGVSSDAIHWTALNNNEPILSSANISSTGGVRDPHILRGEDNKTFFMVATDMFTVKNGWGYNPGIVLLRSKNLIDWSHGIINLEKSYPQLFPNVQWVWAPQTIYDPDEDKYLIYFTVKLKDKPALDFYCAYANKNFTAFENEPRLMFKAKYGAIDGDIIYKDGLYHFFYKGNTKNNEGKETRNGIQQATAKSLRGPWVEDFKYIDAYSGTGTSVEGSGIFKLNNQDTYVLMYDLYGRLRYEFQRSTDLFNFTRTPETFTKNFYPRHGTVMSITTQEAQRISKKWTGVPAQLLHKE
ncbi:glycoside hydrolase family 43 protein [uncultured Mucilaginibacter sp.]|uniref:glycoside hydrolase family 43 protein n=1 Tax=uncultured Mucilaginibacter sp. TaxID=797541 RepID=UPI0025D46E9A|nr:glycoside hydrolase family 43 protein [uncultured Mucilaginibacter sp.]